MPGAEITSFDPDTDPTDAVVMRAMREMIHGFFLYEPQVLASAIDQAKVRVEWERNRAENERRQNRGRKYPMVLFKRHDDTKDFEYALTLHREAMGWSGNRHAYWALLEELGYEPTGRKSR